MHAAALAVRDAQQAMTEHIRTLRGEVEQMICGRPSDAGSAFASIHNSFEEHAARIDSALARMHEALGGKHEAADMEEPEQGYTLET